MELKAYGVTCSLEDNMLIINADSFVARNALATDVRVINLKDITYLDFRKGNIFINARIVVGEARGKTYIPVITLKKFMKPAEAFYMALREAVSGYGRLDSIEPKNLRNDHIKALKSELEAKRQAKIINGLEVSDIEGNKNQDFYPGYEAPMARPNEPVYKKPNTHEPRLQIFQPESVPMTDYNNESMPPIVAEEYAIIDLETTGLSPDKGDRIIEIGIMIVDAAYNIVSMHETLVNPKRKVTLTHVHGIDDRMVSIAPTIEDINEDVLALLHNRIVVAHNAVFEQRFLNSELNGRNLTANNFLDTLKYARLITPTENHKLGTIADFYGVPYVDAHTAMGDVIVTRQVLSKMLPSNPNAQFIASEDLTPYFNTDFGNSQPNINDKSWVRR